MPVKRQVVVFWLIPLKKHGFYRRDKGLEWRGFVIKITAKLALEVEELS